MANISHPPDLHPHSSQARPRFPTDRPVSVVMISKSEGDSLRVLVRPEPRDCRVFVTFAISQECAYAQQFRVQTLGLSGSPQSQACGYV